jgi:hypothetical protein
LQILAKSGSIWVKGVVIIMKYTDKYDKLINERKIFISNSVSARNRLENELHELAAKLNLYKECLIEKKTNDYSKLESLANKDCIDKQEEIDNLVAQVKNAKYEIDVLQELIKKEKHEPFEVQRS